MPIHSQILQWIVPTNKKILLLDNHNITFILSKLTLTYYCQLILISYSCFVSFISDVFYIKRITHYIYLSCLFNVLHSGPVPQSHWLSWSWHYMIWRLQASYFIKTPSIGFFEVFSSWLDSDYAYLAGISQKWCCNNFSLCN